MQTKTGLTVAAAVKFNVQAALAARSHSALRFGAAALCAAGIAVARPPLPTPCSSANCGNSAQSFVTYGKAGAAVSGNTMTVTQATPKAIVNWADFNIANGYTVNFVQPSSTAAVLNNIWSGNPSVIAGQLNANGQVYLYNQNGIIFDKGAQVNVGSLVASTLSFAPVSSSSDPDALFENGILSNNVGASPTSFKPAFQKSAGGGTNGAVSVNGGAVLTAADGGRIMLLGSAVSNQGTINTPDGQTILGAATNAVYLAASSDPSMRGLLIAVDGSGTTGTVTNQGQVTAARGNITLAGLMVNQQGTLTATTSVSANGSIYLVAGDTSGATAFYTSNPQTQNPQTQKTVSTAFGGLLPNNGGTLTLAPGSVTEVQPDATDSQTLNATQQSGFIPSEVDLAAKNVTLQGNASIRAPGGTVNVYAAANPYQQISSARTQPTDDGGSIYLDNGSTIDVSGLTGVTASATQNILQVTLEGNDLQNDPLLRNGFLHGSKVTVNASLGSPLFDVTPYKNNIGLSLGELLTSAGAIQLNASHDVVARAGSTLNVSGGSIAYQGGYAPSTTKLLGADGKVYDISTAPNNIQYIGFANSYSYTDPTWGTKTSATAQTYYPGYTQGENAGVINIQGPQAYLRGTMEAQTIAGIYQRSPNTLAQGGTFLLGCSNCKDTVGNPVYGLDGGVTFSDNISDNLIVDGTSPVSLPSTNTLSPTQLAQSGFNTIDVYSNGSVTLPAGTSLNLAANGGFTAKSTQSIEVDGTVRGPGIYVSLATASTAVGTSENVTLGPGAVIDASGSWINDSPLVTPQPGTTPTAINGGDVSLSAAGNVILGSGSRIDVSGGGWIDQSNKLTKGGAGTISLAASYFAPTQIVSSTNPYVGTVKFGDGVTLLGASLSASGGGTLNVTSGSVTVGLTSSGTPGELLLQPGFFGQGGFSQYNIVGENDVMIGNLADTSNSTPVKIAPLEQTLVFTQNSLFKRTGTDLASFTQLETLPTPQRSPASVSFTSTATDGSVAAGGAASSTPLLGGVTLASDASIVTDPGAQVSLAVNDFTGSLKVFGSIVAPAGNINLDIVLGAQTSGDPAFVPDQQIELGSNALLAAPGFAKIDTLDLLGYREGSVLNGGTVSLHAEKGFVVLNPGSTIDVSGAAGVLDVVNTNGVTPTVVAGNAGTVQISAREGLVLQGDLLGQAATFNGAPVAGAGGGTLFLGLGVSPSGKIIFSNSGSAGTAQTNVGTGPIYPTNPRVVTLTSGQPASPSNLLQSGTADIDTTTIQSGGFDSVTIASAEAITFNGAVSLHTNASLTLDAPLFQGNPGAQATLSSAYVAVGNYFNNPSFFDANQGGSTDTSDPLASTVLNPLSGTANLAVNAQLIDIRGISGWSGFATETFTSAGAGAGDVRFVAVANAINVPPAVNAGGGSFEGALDTSATLAFKAAQLYPTTATSFAINDLPPSTTAPSQQVPTTVTIASSNTAGAQPPATPLSAGGSLTIEATDIEQDGVLRAPMGQLALNGVSISDAQGNVLTPSSVTLGSSSVTSVSADGLTIPYGATANGLQWTYSPNSSLTNVVTQPPAKQISLNGSNVNLNNGAKVDLSGGGDLYGYEFIPGEGGSVDVLNPANASAKLPSGTTVYTYAILPSLGSKFAPIDQQYDQGSTASIGQTIHISGVPGLAAGTYALLPARYALLPGAFAVHVVQQNSGIAQGPSVVQPDGSYVTAGRFGVAGTNTLSSLTSTVLVSSDAVVRTHSQYTDSYANSFFYNAAVSGGTSAPSLPADAGQLLLSATTALNLNHPTVDFSVGSFVSGTNSSGQPITQQGLGGDVSITAQHLIVVDSVSSAPPPSGGAAQTVQLDVQQLDNLNAQTLILGATATNTSAGELLTLGATQSTAPTQTIELANTTALTASNIILAARDSVVADTNAQISASNSSGPPAGTPSKLLLPGGGALLRVSSGAPATLVVDPTTLPQTPVGTLSVGAGANVQASGSLLLYGTNNTTLETGAVISAPAVGLYSSRISLGNVPTGSAAPGGLTLTPQLLGTLQGLTDLTLGSSSTIDFYGAVQLGASASGKSTLNSMTLDAEGLGGYGSGDKVLQAGTITLTNSGSAVPSFLTTPDGTGSLQLIASTTSHSGSGELVLGAGTKTLQGFSGVDLHADGAIYGTGKGELTAATITGPMAISSAAVLGAAGSDQTITAGGAVTFNGVSSSSATSLPAAGLGAKLTVNATDIQQNGTINLPAGILALNALNGGVTLGSGSLTSAAGAYKGFTVTNAVAAGGQIMLTANNGNVTLGNGATVDISGVTSPDGKVSGDAGSLSVSAPNGLFLFAGGTIKGAAPTGQAQGSFTLDVGSLGQNGASDGNGFTALANLLSASGLNGAVDLRTRTGSVFIAGNVDIQASSFQLSADQGAIDVAGTINTSGGTPLDTDGGPIALWAQSALTLEGGSQLLANAGAAGPVGANGSSLAAKGGDITLGTSSGSIIFAGTKQNPTRISMLGGNTDSDGTLTLRAPRTSNDMEVQIQLPNASSVVVDTHKPLIVEGFRSYSATLLGGIDQGCNTGGGECDVLDTNGTLFTEALTFAGNGNGASIANRLAPGITNDLGITSAVQVRPGIEVDSTADLTVGDSGTTSEVWNLDSWYTALGNIPFNLTLRAADNLIFNASLSDGFTATTTRRGGTAPVANWAFGETTSGGDSGSYLLTGGADLGSANPLAVVRQPAPASGSAAVPNSGNVILTPGELIRTGDGSIGIAAGGDVLLGYTFISDSNGTQVSEADPLTSVIYTAGVPSLAPDPSLFAATNIRTTSGIVAPSYPTDGGNISVSADNDIRSAPSAQLITDWLWRRGATNADGTLMAPNQNTSWWVMFNQFQQGIGVLGGGTLTLDAGRDIYGVSAVVPTTGRLLGAAGTSPVAANLTITGGGNLQVRAGGNIESGVFEDDWGNTSITAGGALTSGVTFGQEVPNPPTSVAAPPPSLELYPILVTGNGTFDVSARTGVSLDAVATSTTLQASIANSNSVSTASNQFYTYAPTGNPSTLSLLSAAGDVVLGNNVISNIPMAVLSGTDPASRYVNVNTTPDTYLAVYPSTLNVAALSGDIDTTNTALPVQDRAAGSITLFPSATGNLSLLASGSISATTIDMSEKDPTFVPNALAPGRTAFTGVDATDLPLPLQPLHQYDTQPIYIVAEGGNIAAPGDDPAAGKVAAFVMKFPKAADVIAGGNITDLAYTGKNLNSSDVTLIDAGGNITYSTPTVSGTNALTSNSNGISVAGPGYLEVLAGGNIDLGDSNGIVTNGSLTDPRLPSTGATLVVGAGLGSNTGGGLRQPDYQDFINAYIAPNATTGAAGSYASALVSYMQKLDPTANANLTYTSALTAFEALPRAQQLPLLSQVLNAELDATGQAHTKQGASYDRGYTAINTLFPTKDLQGNPLTYSGNLDMFYSQLKTQQGGDINLLVPGGSVIVGVTDPAPNLSSVKSIATATGGTIPAEVNLGLLVLGQGTIEGFANQDFNVNQSRILTLQGGDIVLWASNGNIDAGRGAKSVSGAPAPIILTDTSGNVYVDPSGAVSGSGIGQLLTVPGITPGHVDLIAPKGTVNAGDAGIRVAGDLNIAALQVLGVGNITVGGTATGVPTSEAGALSGALSGANALGDAGKSAVQELTQNLSSGTNYQQLSESLQPTFIVVKMFCLGLDCQTH